MQTPGRSWTCSTLTILWWICLHSRSPQLPPRARVVLRTLNWSPLSLLPRSFELFDGKPASMTLALALALTVERPPPRSFAIASLASVVALDARRLLNDELATRAGPQGTVDGAATAVFHGRGLQRVTSRRLAVGLSPWSLLSAIGIKSLMETSFSAELTPNEECRCLGATQGSRGQ